MFLILLKFGDVFGVGMGKLYDFFFFLIFEDIDEEEEEEEEVEFFNIKYGFIMEEIILECY